MIHVENGIIEIKGSTFQIGEDLKDLEKVISRNEDIKDGYQLAKKEEKIMNKIFEDIFSK